jgi:hypothetical protein
MCTEKLAKAYYKTDLGKGHKAFRRFMTDLPSNPAAIAPLGFGDLAALTRWQLSAARVADALEDLAPAVADGKNLPNPEYPGRKMRPQPRPSTTLSRPRCSTSWMPRPAVANLPS